VQSELREHLVAPRRELTRPPGRRRCAIRHAPLDEAGVDAIVDAAMRGLAPGD